MVGCPARRRLAERGDDVSVDVLALLGGERRHVRRVEDDVRDLEDRYVGRPGHNAAELARLERQITDVSLRYGVLCRFTAFVAVDSRVVTDGAGPHRVTQPKIASCSTMAGCASRSQAEPS